jgi:hypothetical protein
VGPDDDSVPRLVFVGSVQPGEPCAWGVLAMAETLVTEDGLERARSEFTSDFIPQPDPDGLVAGRSNTNAGGEVTLFAFEDAAAGRPCPREAWALWDEVARRPPLVLVDFHFLPTPGHDQPKPLLLDLGVYNDAERRRLAVGLGRRLVELATSTPPQPVAAGEEPWRGLLVSQAAGRLGSAAFLYHSTERTANHTIARKRGRDILYAVLAQIVRN